MSWVENFRKIYCWGGRLFRTREYMVHFLTQAWGGKKKNPKEFRIFQEMELFSSEIKRFHKFSQMKIFIIFQETELSYILENGTF